MDPNETLRRLRKLINTPTTEATAVAALMEMTDLFGSLDEWISRGGFLPTDWSANQVPR